VIEHLGQLDFLHAKENVVLLGAATVDRKHEANADALGLFLKQLRGADPARERDRADWIAGPWEVRGDGEWLPPSLPVYVAKLTTDLRAVDTGAASC
jgi:hypothetical protein